MNTQLLSQLYPQTNPQRSDFLARSPITQQTKSDVGETEAPIQDSEIQPVTPKSSQQLLNQRILTALNREIASGGAAPVQTLDAADFTPQKVADRIVTFINQAVGLANVNDPTGEAGKKVLEQGRAGVEKGFADARDILEGLGVLDGKIKEDIDQTYALIQKGLDGASAAPGAAPTTTVATTPPAGSPATGSSLAVQSASYSSRKATELTIQTKEGDNITIRLINNQSASATQFSGQGNGLSLTGSSSRSSSQSGFEIQVEGNLNEEEQAAIKDLLGRVDQLAGDFFQGNVDEAFSKALELGFDTEQLSNFSLNLSYSEERAVTAYQQNSSGAGSADASAGAGSNQASGLSQFLQQASDFLKQFKQLLEDDGAKKVFKNPGEAVSDIFTQLVQDRKEARGDDKDKVEKSGHQLRDFLQALTEQVKAQRTGALGAAPAENEEASDGKDAKAKDGKEPAAAA